jgi:hypothetical protein
LVYVDLCHRYDTSGYRFIANPFAAGIVAAAPIRRLWERGDRHHAPLAPRSKYCGRDISEVVNVNHWIAGDIT